MINSYSSVHFWESCPSRRFLCLIVCPNDLRWENPKNLQLFVGNQKICHMFCEIKKLILVKYPLNIIVITSSIKL